MTFLGALPRGGEWHFRVWAPLPLQVDLHLESPVARLVPMQREGEYWTAAVPGLAAGQRYRYRLDGAEAFPDPASRSQPGGPHEASATVDPAAFPWSDGGWTPPPFSDLVIYELHIGTFTPAGTFDSAIERLDYLRDLGVTAIELMPVAEFPGRRNWGYDGVALFAPASPYGGPEALRRLVDAAHARGLAVILDVVYNHFGPSGNYTGRYSGRYLTPLHTTPWGDAVNFDDEGSAHVRDFVLANLRHWRDEYHVDGFRFDATHAITDTSPEHILAAVARTLRPHGSHPYLIAETHENDPRYLLPPSHGGFGFDAVWADDFHHALRTNLVPGRDGYLANFEGAPAELATVIEQGFFFEGQYDRALGANRGHPARDLPWPAFLYCTQNHDQVGNRAFGDRLHARASRADTLAAALLLLLLPQTPLLFQGQEFFASASFQYFTDHEPDLGKAVTAGRREEFRAVATFANPDLRERIPDPQDEATFRRSVLNWDEAESGLGALALSLHRELLRLRATDPVLCAARAGRPPLVVAADGRWLTVTLDLPQGRRLIALNLGTGEATLPHPFPHLRLLLSTTEPRFGGEGPHPEIDPLDLVLPPHSAAFLDDGG